MSGKHAQRKAPFNIPCITESLKQDFEKGLISLEEAAVEFHKANLSAYVDLEYTKKQFGISNKEV